MGPRCGTPYGNRTRIAGSRVRCPQPLEERGELLWCRGEESNLHAFRQRVLNPPCLPVPATPANVGAFARTRTEIPALRGRSSAIDLRRRKVSGAAGGSRTLIPCLKGRSSGR